MMSLSSQPVLSCGPNAKMLGGVVLTGITLIKGGSADSRFSSQARATVSGSDASESSEFSTYSAVLACEWVFRWRPSTSAALS